MATYNSKNKSVDGCAQQEYWINIRQLTIYPNGYQGQLTKLGLLWRTCSEDTFLRHGGRVPPGLEASCQLFVCLDYSTAVAACLPSDMKRLTTAQKDLFWPVGYYSRLGLLERVLQFGMNCKVGDCVLAVSPSGKKLPEPTKFTVRYKGPLREADRGSEYTGTFFGLVSTEPIKSSANNTISCFADVYFPDVVQYARRERTEADHQAVLCHLEWIVALVDKKFALKAGDKVLWFVDDRPAPLRGVVVRILDEKFAMVDFDIDGKKKQMDVVIESLMLASDFDIDTSERPASEQQLKSNLKAAAAAATPSVTKFSQLKLDQQANNSKVAGQQQGAQALDKCVRSPDSLDPNFVDWNIIPVSSVGKNKCIGDDGIGRLYKAFTDRYQTVAVKIVKIDAIKDASRLEQVIKKEQDSVEILKRVRHNNILVFLKAELIDAKQFCVFTELVAGYTLTKLLILQGAPFEEAAVKFFSRQICSALNFLHHGEPVIVHRHINSNNILLSNEGIIKLVGFGIAQAIVAESIAQDTLYYMAPEQFDLDGDIPYSPKSDVWAFGCTLFEMLQMQPPNRNLRVEEISIAVLTRDMPRLTDPVSDSLSDFYNRCIVKDPKLRPDTDQLLQHIFLVDN